MNANAPKHEPSQKGGDGQSPARSVFERALVAALHDVPVPGDLAERLIAQLESEATPPPGTDKMPARRRIMQFTRKRMLMAAGSLAVVVLLGLGIGLLRRAGPEIAREELSRDVANWVSMLPAKSWRPMASLPKSAEIDAAMGGQPRQWQSFHHASAAGWSGNVTAIDLAQPSAPRAVLFVVRSNRRFAVPSSPTTTVRLGLSSGYAATAWQRPSNVLYVLLIETGGEQRLEDFVRRLPQA